MYWTNHLQAIISNFCTLPKIGANNQDIKFEEIADQISVQKLNSCSLIIQ